VLLLHPNTIPRNQAEIVFDEMEKAVDKGKIKSFGWSTDYVDNATSMVDRAGFVAVEHAMHVLMDAPNMQKLLSEKQVTAFIRSPLAMGLLSGKYNTESTMPSDDIRSTEQEWTRYYVDGRPNAEYLDRLESKSPSNIPVPGARTAEQVEGLAKAMDFGELPANVMAEIDSILDDRFISLGVASR